MSVRTFLSFVLAGICILAASGSANAIDAEALSVSDLSLEDQMAVNESAELGEQLYRRVTAARTTTRKLVDDGKFPDERMVSWISENQGKSVIVKIIGLVEGQERILHEATVRGRKLNKAKIVSHNEGRSLTSREQSAFAANRLVAAQTFEMCDVGYEIVVIPSSMANEAATTVFLLAAVLQNDLVNLDGHVQVTVDAANETVLKTEYINKGCTPIDPQAVGSQTKVAMMSHLHNQVERIPSAVHFYFSRHYGTPILVFSGKMKRIWELRKGRVHSITDVLKPVPVTN